jgi:hypothetical protein
MEQHKLTISQYFKVLGLETDSTVEEIKKAYRKKACESHPDLNPSPNAKDIFILATEAYEFLITYREKISTDEEAYNKAMNEWRKYRQNRSRYRANVYARAPYNRFKTTNFYKTTRIFDGTTIIFCLIISVLELVLSVIGYIIRLRHPDPTIGKPSVFVLIMFLLFGMTLFVISYVYLKAYMQSSQKYKKHNEENN